MSLRFWRFVMALAWTCDEYTTGFVKCSQRAYLDAVRQERNP